MTPPRITACIVTYKSKLDDVFRAVESLCASTLPIQIIVVDNHSGTEYRAQLTETLAAFPNVRIANSGGNKGFGAGHNFGFKAVEDASDFHLVVNPDIMVHEGAIENMIEYMQSHPEIGLMAPRIVDENGELQHLCKRYPSLLVLFGRRCMPKYLLDDPVMIRVMDRYHMRDHDYNEIMEPECISGCFMLFRSNIFKSLEGFDESFFLYFEDNDITLRARKISKVIYYPKAVVTHAWEGGSRKSFHLTKLQIKSAIKFFNKWKWKVF